MDNVKNNFEEMKKLLLGALEILEQTNSGLVERIKVLEERVKELEQQMSGIQQPHGSGLDNAPTAILCAASAASMDDEVAEDEVAEDEVAEDEVAEEEVVADAEKEQTAAEHTAAEHTASEQTASEQTASEQTAAEQTAAEEFAEAAAEHTAAEEFAEAEAAAAAEEEEEEFAEAAEEVIAAEAAAAEAAEEEAAAVAAEFAVADDEEDVEDAKTVEAAEAAVAAEEETQLESVGSLLINDFVADEPVRIVNEAAKPDWYDWEVDYPAEYVDDVYKGISFNDRYEFIKELFNVTGSLDEAEMAFKQTLDTINNLEHFKQVVAYIRDRFPMWDEQSDEVYRFYMAVRRKFNK